MKNKIIAVVSLITIICMCLFGGTNVYAEESTDISELYTQVDELLEEYSVIYSIEDIENLTLENIIQGLHDTIVSRVTAPFKLLGIIAVIIIFSAFVSNTNESVINKGNNMTDIICTLTAVTVISNPLIAVYEEVTGTIILYGEFMNVFVPLFTMICAVSGNISSIGLYNGIVLGASQIIVWISDTYLLPILTMTMALSVANSVCSRTVCEGIVSIMRKGITWVLTVSTMLFSGFLTIKNTLGTATDTFASKTAKFVISGFVPVIGGAVSDAYSTVKGSVSVLKCTSGMAGILIAVLIFVPPLIELVSFRVVMKIGCVLSEMFSVNSIGKLLKNLENGTAIAMSVMICFALLFIVSTAVLMKTNVA